MKRNLLIGLMAIGVLVFSVGFATYAYFTSQATSADNTFTTGTLSISEPGQIVANLPVGSVYPGAQIDKQVNIINNGSLDLKYKMTINPVEETILYNGLTPLEVRVNTGEWKKINELGSVELGEILANATKDAKGTVNISFRLPVEADNDYQGVTGKFNIVFDATQKNNPGWN